MRNKVMKEQIMNCREKILCLKRITEENQYSKLPTERVQRQYVNTIGQINNRSFIEENYIKGGNALKTSVTGVSMKSVKLLSNIVIEIETTHLNNKPRQQQHSVVTNTFIKIIFL